MINLKQIETDWFGNPAQAHIAYSLSVDERALTFEATCAKSPWHDPTDSIGDFKEGLWQKEVAEFFLLEDGSERYQEFNLAPSGAWWTGVFSSYREECKPQPQPPKVTCTSDIRYDSWRASMTIQREALAIDFNFNQDSRANVCFIIGDETNRQFLTVGDLGSGKPDFHKTEYFPFFNEL